MKKYILPATLIIIATFLSTGYEYYYSCKSFQEPITATLMWWFPTILTFLAGYFLPKNKL